MTKFKIGDKVIRQAKYRDKMWFAGDTPVTVASVSHNGSIGLKEDPRSGRKWSQSYFDLVSLPTFEVGKLYKTSRSQDLYEMLGVTETYIWYKNIRTGIHVSNPIEYDFSKSLEEYIPPPPEEWRALFYVENGKPEISAVYFSTQIACEEYFRHRETKNQIENNLKDGAFMYAIRTDINAKKEN